MARSLPRRPDLDHLKREAKRLLREARDGAPGALALLRNLPACRDASDAELKDSLSLHQMQHALALDYGHPGWRDLKQHVEASTPVLAAPRPVLRIDSYEKAVEHYVGWLGFTLDWDWREGAGAPTIAAFSRDGFAFMANEHPTTLGPTAIHVNVKNLDAFVRQLNERRPGSAEVRIAPPYEFADLPVQDPFGNVIVFEGQDAAEQERRNAVRPRMRAYVQAELDAGRDFPTPEQIREAVGPPLGVAIEVLNEYPDYAEVFLARQAEKEVAQDE